MTPSYPLNKMVVALFTFTKKIGHPMRNGSLLGRFELGRRKAQGLSPSDQSSLRLRTVQELRGKSGVTMAMIYTHVLNQGGRGIRRLAHFDSLDSE